MNFKLVPTHEIKPYENNPRQHPVRQLEAITKSIQRHGFRGTILLDRNNVIVAGHARYEAACVAGLSEIPCEYADDLTDEQITEFRILDNEIASMSFNDLEKLYAELEKIPDCDFSEFGVTFPESGEVVKNHKDEWNDMPEFDQQDKTAFRSIIVHFKSQEDVDEFAKTVFQKITDRTKMIWFPQIEIEPVADIRYENTANDAI